MVRKLSKSDVVVLWYGIGLLQSHWSENSKDHGNSLKKPSDPFFFLIKSERFWIQWRGYFNEIQAYCECINTLHLALNLLFYVNKSLMLCHYKYSFACTFPPALMISVDTPTIGVLFLSPSPSWLPKTSSWKAIDHAPTNS